MRELIREGYIGHPAQMCTLRRFTLEGGKARGAEVIEAVTAGGLQLDILPDTGLDLGQARFKGTNMSWMSKNGYDAPGIIHPFESDFEHTFPGGLMYTCGMRSAGPANRDGAEWHPIHGRYHSLAADQVNARIDGDMIEVSGVIRETALFGHALECRRVIRIPVWGASVTVKDEITNLSPRDEEIMMIYHCNFGYPLLSEKARLILPPDRETIPRTEFAESGLDKLCVFDRPIPSEEERVFFHIMENDFSASLVNPDLGVTMTIAWSGDTLPILGHWRSMASGDYVLGLEPTNCYIMGRHFERMNGTLKALKAFETVKNTVTIRFEEEKDDV